MKILGRGGLLVCLSIIFNEVSTVGVSVELFIAKVCLFYVAGLAYFVFGGDSNL